MTTVIGVLTGQTCAANCWYAREPECRCSCGGDNHGVLLTDGAEQPRRNCTILGHRYVLGMIGRYSECERRMGEFARSDFMREKYGRDYPGGYRGGPITGTKGGVAWRKSATAAQARQWPEIPPHIDPQRPWVRPSLLWIREDVADEFDRQIS